MTTEQKEHVRELYNNGLGYLRISSIMGIPQETVRSHIKRNLRGIERKKIPVKHEMKMAQEYHLCKECGKLVAQNPGRKEKLFCSDECRIKWWNRNKYSDTRKANHQFICKTCGASFAAYGTTKRKYCSNRCYIKGRFYSEEVTTSVPN